MTFDPNIPNSAQSPYLAPSQISTNMGRLKTIINAEHVFNDTTGVTDGVHRQMTMVARANPSSLPAGTNGIVYNKVEGSTALPYYYDGTSVFKMPVLRAAATWNSAGVLQGQSFNVTSVTVAAGEFTVTFTVPLPSVYFQYTYNMVAPAASAAYAPRIISVTQVGATVTKLKMEYVNINDGVKFTSFTQQNLMIFGG